MKINFKFFFIFLYAICMDKYVHQHHDLTIAPQFLERFREISILVQSKYETLFKNTQKIEIENYLIHRLRVHGI